MNVNCSSTSPEATLELKVFLAVQWFLQTVNFKYDLNRKAIRREGMINAKILKTGYMRMYRRRCEVDLDLTIDLELS